MPDGQSPSPETKKPLQFRRLSSPPDLRRANQKIVNALLAGKIDPDVANSVFRGLKNIQAANDSQQFDGRLEELESRAAMLAKQDQASGGGYGHARH